MIISIDEFKLLVKCGDSLANKYYYVTVHQMEKLGITPPVAIAGFLAQVSVETGGLVYMREIWGNTIQQQKYDPPHALASRLGNTEEGDGFKYRGGGMLQITGKRNYSVCGLGIGVDLEGYPELIIEPELSALSACWWWKHMGLGTKIEKEGIDAVTKTINGGTNQEIERRNHFKDNLKILCV